MMTLLRSDLDAQALGAVRQDLFRLHEDPDVAQHVKDGAAALLNYYGAVLDQRVQQTTAAVPTP